MKKRKTNKSKIYSVMISIVSTILMILCTYVVFKINILPFKYLIIYLSLILLNSLIVFILFKIKKKKSILRNVMSVFVTIFSIILILGFLYINKTTKFLNNILSSNVNIENYIVVVNSNSNISTIDDLKNKKIGYSINTANHLETAIKKLQEIISFDKEQMENYDELLNDLLDNSIDAIVIEKSYKDILINENEFYDKFNEKTKAVYEFIIEIKLEDIEKEIDVLKDNFNIYISGIDTYGNISSVSRSDVNIIMSINPKTNQILLITIPRDYYVQLNGTIGYKDKLTHAGIYGVDKSIKTIEDLLDININYYIKVNFTSLIKIVDSIGEIDVYSEYDFSGETYSFKKGYNKMDGKQALEFSRTRKTVSGGDRTRGKNQEAVIAAIIKKISSPSIIVNYSNILNSLSNTFTTNISQEKITSIIKKQLDENNKWNISSISLNGKDAYEYTYSYKTQKLYVMVPIEESIQNAKNLLLKNKNGEILENTYKEIEEVNDTTLNNTKEVKVEENKNINNITEPKNTEEIVEEEIINEENCTLVDGICMEDYVEENLITN